MEILKGEENNVIPFNEQEREKWLEEKHKVTKKAFDIAASVKAFLKKDTE